MLLGHAFEPLDCIAVEFRTHFFNHQSRRGIERLGAKLDGILRSHQIAPNGSLRDTCRTVYSIIAQRMAGREGASPMFQMEKSRNSMRCREVAKAEPARMGRPPLKSSIF